MRTEPQAGLGPGRLLSPPVWVRISGFAVGSLMILSCGANMSPSELRNSVGLPGPDSVSHEGDVSPG